MIWGSHPQDRYDEGIFWTWLLLAPGISFFFRKAAKELSRYPVVTSTGGICMVAAQLITKAQTLRFLTPSSPTPSPVQEQEKFKIFTH